MGVDRGIHVVLNDKEYEGLQPLAVAKLFQKITEQENPNLILLGKQVMISQKLLIRSNCERIRPIDLTSLSKETFVEMLRYQPPFRTVCAWIAVVLVVFIKTPINHIFFKSLIIPDYGFELTKTIYLNVFRNWNALCKRTRLYKSCSTPAGNKQKKTINTAFVSQHVPLKNHVSDFLTSAFVFLLLTNEVGEGN